MRLRAGDELLSPTPKTLLIAGDATNDIRLRPNGDFAVVGSVGVSPFSLLSAVLLLVDWSESPPILGSLTPAIEDLFCDTEEAAGAPFTRRLVAGAPVTRQRVGLFIDVAGDNADWYRLGLSSTGKFAASLGLAACAYERACGGGESDPGGTLLPSTCSMA